MWKIVVVFFSSKNYPVHMTPIDLHNPLYFVSIAPLVSRER